MWWGGSRAESDCAAGSHTQKLGTTAWKHIGFIEAPRVQLWKSYHSFLSGSQGGEAVALWDRRLLRKTNGCGEGRALTAVKVFAHSLTFFEVRRCMCAHGWTPNPHCHLLFPAKHLATDQDNWLSVEAKKPYILHWYISTANLPVYLSPLQHTVTFFL